MQSLTINYKMSINSGNASDKKLLGHFLLPSWLSAVVSVFAGVMVIGGTIVLTHFGTVVQQSLLGLHSAYQQSAVGVSVGAVAGRFTHNATLGNVLFFLSWGLVGLVVYSIAEGFAREFRAARNLSRELKYSQLNRKAVLKNVGTRTAIRICALIALLLAIRLIVYKVIPYGIVTAHTGALHLTSAADWLYCLIAGVVCMASSHVLTVLLRLLFLRVRLLGGGPVI